MEHTRRHGSGREIWRRLLPVCVLVWLPACSVNPHIELAEWRNVQPPEVSLAPPFFSQTANQCGPAALAAVLGAAGVEVGPEQLSPGVYLPDRKGSLQIELVAATRLHHRVPFELASSVDALIAELAGGRPVLLLQNLGTRSFPVWHYAVLTGYDLERNAFRLNSGTEQGVWISAPRLLRTWEWGGRWAMVVLRPGDLPAAPVVGSEPGPVVGRYLRAVADFETVAGSDAALPAWQAAAQRWPGEAAPALALGNLAYQKGRRREAAQWFARGLSQHPADPVLANNLATVLGEVDCARSGEAVLQPLAERLDSRTAWWGAVHDTLEVLAAQPGPDPEFCDRLLHAAVADAD